VLQAGDVFADSTLAEQAEWSLEAKFTDENGIRWRKKMGAPPDKLKE